MKLKLTRLEHADSPKSDRFMWVNFEGEGIDFDALFTGEFWSLEQWTDNTIFDLPELTDCQLDELLESFWGVLNISL